MNWIVDAFMIFIAGSAVGRLRARDQRGYSRVAAMGVLLAFAGWAFDERGPVGTALVVVVLGLYAYGALWWIDEKRRARQWSNPGRLLDAQSRLMHRSWDDWRKRDR